MTDLEISKALALAIGWTEDKITLSRNHPNYVFVPWRNSYDGVMDTRSFDYRDWNVIGPIAAKYDCFPMKSTEKPEEWFTYAPGDAMNAVYADTPQKAIALAVIGAKT